MLKLNRLIFGQVEFGESEEYLEFQFRFLCVVLISGALFTLLFLVGDYSHLNSLSQGHVRSMEAFTTITFVLWLFLRGRKHWFLTIGWLYEAACMLEYISALTQVPEDELRLLWFYLNIPGVYILLGQRAGLVITLTTLALLAGLNPFLSHPYSQPAMATALVSMAYLGMFFHVYGNRSISYFTRLQASNRHLHQMATHDPLTGVLNARAYYENCDRLMRLEQRGNSPYAVLFVDLDHFKRINDTYGHAAGDIVLRNVATCLGASIRHSDLLGRIGGEEFSIFLPSTDLAGAMQLAESIRLAIEGLEPDIGNQHLPITASIGVAGNRQIMLSMQEIQRQADQAMYQAKAAGRNRVSSVTENSGADTVPA